MSPAGQEVRTLRGIINGLVKGRGLKPAPTPGSVVPRFTNSTCQKHEADSYVGYPPKADLIAVARLVRYVPILLIKSFFSVD